MPYQAPLPHVAASMRRQWPSLEVFPAPCVPPWHPRPSLRLLPTAVSELGVGQAEAAADCEGVGGRPEFLELVRPPFVGERADAVAPAERLEASLGLPGAMLHPSPFRCSHLFSSSLVRPLIIQTPSLAAAHVCRLILVRWTWEALSSSCGSLTLPEPSPHSGEGKPEA